MNLSCGIIGLPNAGKSTLFNALLKKQVAYAANFPFATIEPNIGVVPVPDERLERIADVIAWKGPHPDPLLKQGEGKRPPVVPATVKFVDIAGLVAGASKGEGLGNKFLAHIREVDLICHVIRIFKDADVVHVAGEVDPEKDKATIETELILADLQTLEKQIEPRGVKDKETQRKWELIQLLIKELNQGKKASEVITDDLDKLAVKDLQLLTMKPELYVANVGESELSNNQIIQLSNYPINQKDIVVISAKIEAELAGLAEEEQKAYLKELGLEKSGLERLIQKAYQKLDLISFLTGGEIEARAWTIKQGTKAPQAAGVIHTDFEKHFIKAEVVAYAEFVKAGGWAKAREQGKVRLEGKEYMVQDGDVVDFKVNV